MNIYGGRRESGTSRLASRVSPVNSPTRQLANPLTRQKAAFTLLELLVASLLMGMMISILTMVFNSSSIAWRTGKAGIASLSETRRKLSFAQKVADNVLPGVKATESGTGSREIGLVVGAWDWKRGLKDRAVIYQGNTPCEGDNKRLDFARSTFQNMGNPMNRATFVGWEQVDTSIRSSKSRSSYTVGVKSAGPDRRFGSPDDISSWPEDK